MSLTNKENAEVSQTHTIRINHTHFFEIKVAFENWERLLMNCGEEVIILKPNNDEPRYSNGEPVDIEITSGAFGKGIWNQTRICLEAEWIW